MSIISSFFDSPLRVHSGSQPSPNCNQRMTVPFPTTLDREEHQRLTFPPSSVPHSQINARAAARAARIPITTRRRARRTLNQIYKKPVSDFFFSLSLCVAL